MPKCRPKGRLYKAGLEVVFTQTLKARSIPAQASQPEPQAPHYKGSKPWKGESSEMIWVGSPFSELCIHLIFSMRGF
jgi:hypothetical protein